MKHPFEIDSVEDLRAQLPDLHDQVVQHVDLRGLDVDWSSVALDNSVFLGCTFASEQDRRTIQSCGAVIFPGFDDLPYHPYRASLYTVDELMEGYAPSDDQSLDLRIYQHFSQHRHSGAPILECLAQRIHDHAIDDALEELLAAPERYRRVAIMGGHGTPRSDPNYRKVVQCTRALARDGYFVITGGGPGMMEAGNLGAWLAPYPDSALDEAFELMAVADRYNEPEFIPSAQRVVERFPQGGESLAIPTWFYGHEPSNLFSRHIAKYFSNSLREDGLLAIATHGVVYAPGSAGTLQEVFMDLCQNHYKTFTWRSPMVFLDRGYWEEQIGLMRLLRRFTAGRSYADMIDAFDEPEHVVAFLADHPPAAV